MKTAEGAGDAENNVKSGFSFLSPASLRTPPFSFSLSFLPIALSLQRMPFSRPKRRTYSEDELYEYAVGALARRMRTVAELKRLMRARIEDADSEYGQTLVELVIRRLKDQGYLNDSQYAAYYSSLRRDNQKLGRMRVVTELKTRGVHASVIEKAIETAYEGVSDEKQAREYLRKKRLEKPKDQKQVARIFRQLARAGFGTKTIFTILKKWDVDDETLTALEGEAS
jgi:regulatory protein